MLGFPGGASGTPSESARPVSGERVETSRTQVFAALWPPVSTPPGSRCRRSRPLPLLSPEVEMPTGGRDSQRPLSSSSLSPSHFLPSLPLFVLPSPFPFTPSLSLLLRFLFPCPPPRSPTLSPSNPASPLLRFRTHALLSPAPSPPPARPGTLQRPTPAAVKEGSFPSHLEPKNDASASVGPGPRLQAPLGCRLLAVSGPGRPLSPPSESVHPNAEASHRFGAKAICRVRVSRRVKTRAWTFRPKSH